MTYTHFQSIIQMQEYFKECIQQSSSTAIIGGHFSLEPHKSLDNLQVKPGVEDDDIFGIFPQITWSYACELVKFSKEQKKESKLVLMIDDHSLMYPRNWYARVEQDQDSRDTQKAVQRYFSHFQLPEFYQETLQKYNLTLQDILPSSQGLSVFQESYYRLEYLRKHGVDRTCAGEFEFILEEIAHKGFDNLIGYIPLRCREPTCGALVSTSIGLKQNTSSQKIGGDLAYFVTDSNINTPELFEKAHDYDHHGLLTFHCTKD
ncbi:MAG: hypothetical protein AABY00_02905 [Nanoarchaeota archaeon]